MLDVIKKRTKNVLGNDIGASNVEVVVWIAIIILIVAALIVLKKAIIDKLKNTGNSVTSM